MVISPLRALLRSAKRSSFWFFRPFPYEPRRLNFPWTTNVSCSPHQLEIFVDFCVSGGSLLGFFFFPSRFPLFHVKTLLPLPFVLTGRWWGVPLLLSYSIFDPINLPFPFRFRSSVLESIAFSFRPPPSLQETCAPLPSYLGFFLSSMVSVSLGQLGIIRQDGCEYPLIYGRLPLLL